MSILIYCGFLVFVSAMILLDLGVFHKKGHAVTVREAVTWTCVWVSIALLFSGVIYAMYDPGLLNVTSISNGELSGKDAFLQFLTGYLLEYSLSVDNIFVIALIIATFRVPVSQQHRVLFWGVMGAVVLRGIMIGIGAQLVEKYHWILYLFGALLIYSAFKLLFEEEDEFHPEESLFYRLARRLYPVTPDYHEGKFFVTIDGVRHATPLFLTILLVESSDLMFAVDSIPAVFGITNDPFLVFTSNIFAILGLRSLYFALSGLMDKFRYLKLSLVLILAFVGVKMLLPAIPLVPESFQKIPNGISLGVILSALTIGILASLYVIHEEAAAHRSALMHEMESIAFHAYRNGKKLVILVVGLTVILAGIVMLVTPGPGVAFIVGGLVLLSAEFAWAKVWLARLKRQFENVAALVKSSGPEAANSSSPAEPAPVPPEESAR